jgi:hypothetical protein
VHEQSLEHVLGAAHVRAAETTNLGQMRKRSRQQLAALSEEACPAVTTDAPSIRIDRVTLRLLIERRLGPRSGSLMYVRISSVSRSWTVVRLY